MVVSLSRDVVVRVVIIVIIVMCVRLYVCMCACVWRVACSTSIKKFSPIVRPRLMPLEEGEGVGGRAAAALPDWMPPQQTQEPGGGMASLSLRGAPLPLGDRNPTESPMLSSSSASPTLSGGGGGGGDSASVTGDDDAVARGAMASLAPLRVAGGHSPMAGDAAAKPEGHRHAKSTAAVRARRWGPVTVTEDGVAAAADTAAMLQGLYLGLPQQQQQQQGQGPNQPQGQGEGFHGYRAGFGFTPPSDARGTVISQLPVRTRLIRTPATSEQQPDLQVTSRGVSCLE